MMLPPVELTTANQLLLSNTVNVSVTGSTLVLSRPFDCLQPLFYAIHQGQLWWSQHYPLLVEQLQQDGVPLTVNRDYIRDFLAYQAPLTWDTLFAPIRFLRAGESHRLTLVEGRLQTCSFSPGEPGTPLTVPTFRQALQQQLAALKPSSTVFHISSGLDSSLLALLAAQLHRPDSIQLASCSTRGSGCTSELDMVRRLADDIGATLTVHDLTELDVFATGKTLVNDCLGYPLAHSSHLVEYAMDKAILSEGGQTIVNGKGPDDCLGGYAAHLPSFADTQAHRKRLTVTGEPLLIALFGPGNGVAGQFWQNAGGMLSLQQRLHYDARALTDSWNAVHSAIAHHLDCQIVSPFMQRNIRMGLFALGDADRIVQTQQKVFMRKAFADVYPAYLLSQPKAGLRLDLQPYFNDYDVRTLMAKILGESGQTGVFVDVKTVRWLIDQTLSGERNFGWQLWSLFLVFSAIDSLGVMEWSKPTVVPC
jgi:asparagine synthetase B (glutamine-hydrolysing)